MLPADLVPSLVAWYGRSHRDLPWRRSRDPYRIWLAEAMLQQTRVEAALPYWERFVEELPTLSALAQAPLDRVLALWSGLGYYGRARSLHAAARECRERYGGRVPDDPDLFGALPGVGPYTRAAVQSIAFGAALAVVDGNVLRVVARVFTLPGQLRSSELLRRVTEKVDKLLPSGSPGDFNQALMELGATVCTPRAPRCGGCPILSGCAAGQSGDPERWPRPAPRRATQEVRWQAALIERRGRVLLARRPDTGRWRGMWELPWTDGAARTLGERYGLVVRLGRERARLKHSVLHERITVTVRDAQLQSRPPRGRFAWVAPGEMDSFARSSVWKKVFAQLLPPVP